MEPDGTVRRVKTDQGDIDVEQVVVGVGPWIESLWEMLGLSHKVDVRTPEGEVHENQHSGPTGTCRRVRSTSTRSCCPWRTAACRRCSTSTPTHRSTTTRAS